ncbi:MAG: Hpt domain-containing protein [Anaerolineales bacterium]|nr:Hpt domain-containing protein [Anaerolineales bacterium]
MADPTKEQDEGVPVLDPAMLEAVVEMIGPDEPAAIVDLIDTFVDDSSQQITVMGVSFRAGDWKTLHRIAHSMKSSSATFGAMRMSALCAQLESSARDNCAAGGCGELIEQIEDEYKRVAIAISVERARFAV